MPSLTRTSTRILTSYETFLQPTDDLRLYPYLAYDNALVWKALTILAALLRRPALLSRPGARARLSMPILWSSIRGKGLRLVKRPQGPIGIFTMSRPAACSCCPSTAFAPRMTRSGRRQPN